VALTFVESFGDIAPGTIFRYQADSSNPKHWPATLDVTDGQIIAIDQDGRPALVAHSYEKGKTLLSAYPLETYLAVLPSAFERPEETHRIYRGLAQWAGLAPLFSTDIPGVEVAGLIGDGHGYAVLANHQPEKRSVMVTSHRPLKSIQSIEPDGKQPIALKNNQWQMEIPAYGGAVVEWTR
jgi:hypothetical protein